MQNRKLSLCLLTLASAALIASCGGNTPASSSGESQAESSTGTSEATSAVVSSDESEAEVVPTGVKKKTDLGYVYVGSVLTGEDLFTFTPEGATAYTLDSKNPEVAALNEDGKSVTIIASGKATIHCKINGVAKAKIDITCVSETGAKVQQFANTVKNQFRADLDWKSYEGKSLSNVDLTKDPDSVEYGTLIVQPEYVVDYFFGEYSAIRLESDDTAYGFELVDADGEPIEQAEDDTCFQDMLDRAVDVEIGERVSDAFIDLYFVQENLLDITAFEEYEEDDQVYFTLSDNTASSEQLGSIFGASFRGFSDGVTQLTFDEENQALNFIFAFSYSGSEGKSAEIISITLTAGDAAKVDLLENAVKNAEPPVPYDYTDLAARFAEFNDNFFAAYEFGYFDYQTAKLLTADDYAQLGVDFNTNSRGYIAADGNDILWSNVEVNYLTGEDDGEVNYGGLHIDAENGGVYNVKADEDGVAVLDAEPAEGTQSIKARADLRSFNLAKVTADVLTEAAPTPMDDLGTAFSYQASFDGGVLSSIFDGFVPLAFKDDPFADPTASGTSGWIIGNIVSVEDDEKGINMLSVGLYERVSFRDVDGNPFSVLMGFNVTFMSPGDAESGLGMKFAEYFGYDSGEEEESSEESSSDVSEVTSDESSEVTSGESSEVSSEESSEGGEN